MVSKKYNTQIEKLESNIVNKHELFKRFENFESYLSSVKETNETLRMTNHMTDLHLDRYL